MKTLPDIDVSYDRISRILLGPIQSQLVLSAIELKVFNFLSSPATATSVAQKTGTHPGNTLLLLNGLAALDLLAKKNGLFLNSREAEAFLVETSPTYLGEMFQAFSVMQHSNIPNLTELVKKGPQAENKQDMSGKKWAKATSYLANYQRSGIAQYAAELVSKLPEYNSFGKMLDLGGGPGLIGISIASSHPSMKGVIFDLPDVVKSAEPLIREYGMEGRIDLVGGNYNEDDIGEGYDLIWSSINLYFARGNFKRIMEKIYNALNENGVFISYHEGLTHERTKPAWHVMTRVSLSMAGQDTSFDQGYIADAMIQEGFRSVRSRSIETPTGPIDLDIGRK